MAVATVSFKTTASQLLRMFKALGNEQMPFAESLIANRLAQVVKKNEMSVLRQRIDRPTPWTTNSLRLKVAKKSNPVAEVGFRDVPRFPIDWHYLLPQVGGGGRNLKGFERVFKAAGLLPDGKYLLPASGARLDAFGNMSRGQLSQIMSALRLAEHVSGYSANASGSKRSKRTQRRSGANRYFWGTLDGATGVWQRVESGFGDGARPVLLVVEGVRYRSRYPFDKIAENTVRAHYVEVSEKAISDVIASIRAKA